MTAQPADDRKPILAVSDLRFAYGGNRAVDGVSLRIPAGAFVGLIGPNGAGKSTLIDCVSGVLPNYTGEVEFNGVRTTRWPSYRVARIGLIRTFQATRLFPRLTTMSNLMVGAQRQLGEQLHAAWFRRWRRHQAPHIRRAFELAEKHDLARVTDHYGSELSGGQRKLAELARSLMPEPVMLLLDEPFAGVSPAMRDRLLQQLVSMRRETGVTVLMIEHRLELIEAMCDYVYVMAAGKVLAEGRMDELRRNQSVLDAYLGVTVQ